MKYTWPLWLAITASLLLVATSRGFIVRADPMNMQEMACTYFTGKGIATVYLVGEGMCSVLFQRRSISRCPDLAVMPAKTCEARF